MPAESAEAVASFRNFSEARGTQAKPSPASATTGSEAGEESGLGSGGKGGGSGGEGGGSGGESGAGSGPSSRSSSSFASRSLARSLIDRCRSRLAAVAYRRYSEIDRDSSNNARSDAPARSSAARDFSTFLVSRASFARSERTNALSRFTLAGPEEPATLEPRPATARTQSHQIAFGSPKPCAPASTAASSAPERAGSSNHDPPPGGAPRLPGRLVIRPRAGGPSSSDRRPSRRVATNR